MKSAMVSFKVDIDGSIAEWVCKGLKTNTDWLGEYNCLGIYLDDKLIAGIILNNIRKNIDVWLTIYSENKRWCNRKVLRLIFGYIFDIVNARRASLLVSKDNEASKSLVERLGFECEGLLRQYGDNGEDRYVYGMLKQNCIWRGKDEQSTRNKKSQD